MTTCSDGDSFYLDAFHRWGSLGSLDGCYSDSGYTENFLPEYFRSGAKVEDEPVVLASSDFGSQEIWVLAHYTPSPTGVFTYRCKDAFDNDASLIHPTEVSQWDCEEDGEYTRFDDVQTTCGCSTPAPTTPAPTTPAPTTPSPAMPSPTPSPAALEPTPGPTTLRPATLSPVSPSSSPSAGPSSCGATESFRIMSEGFPEVEGCFQATDESFSNPGSTFEVWSISGNTQYDQVIVAGLADDGTGEVSDSVYLLVYFGAAEDDRITYCQSNEDAIVVHPVDATWQCDLSGTGLFVPATDVDISFRCGCTTPAPFFVEPPSPTPPPSPAPLGAVIGGVVGGAALLVIAGGVLVAKRRRDNKRNGSSGNLPPARNLPVIIPHGGGKNLPIIIPDGDGGKNLPVLPDDRYINAPLASGDAALAPVGGEDSRLPPLAPTAISEPPPPSADLDPASGDLPPPPPYTEPPEYSG